jgi:bacteriocin-like protein
VASPLHYSATMKTITTTTLATVSGGSKADRIAKLNSIFGPEELPPLGASDADAWKFYTGKKLK